MTIDGGAFRSALGSFVTGITVVTALDARERPFGLTVNSFNSVSLDPPLVLFSLGRQTHVFWDLLKAQHFAVNVLASDQQPLSERFAAPVADRFAGLAWRSGRWGAPLIKGCVANLECAVEHTYQGGDHVIFVGRVGAIAVDAKREPLAYCRGTYHVLGPEAEAAAPRRARAAS